MGTPKNAKNKAILEPVLDKTVVKEPSTKVCECGFVVTIAKTGKTGCPRCGRLQAN